MKQAQITWTDDQIAQLRQGIMAHYMAVLAEGYSYSRAQDEAWEWLLSDKAGPFSFVAIAAMAGSDPDQLRINFFNFLVRGKTAARSVRERAAMLLLADRPVGTRHTARAA